MSDDDDTPPASNARANTNVAKSENEKLCDKKIQENNEKLAELGPQSLIVPAVNTAPERSDYTPDSAENPGDEVVHC